MWSRQAGWAIGADVVCVLAFCAVGRRSHAEGITATGLADTAWPFLSGTAVGWLLVFGWHRRHPGRAAPAALVPTGVTVWLATVVVGMLLRKAGGQGVAVSFVVVATLVTGVALLGWRAAASAVRASR